jgi:hypothetical protein
VQCRRVRERSRAVRWSTVLYLNSSRKGDDLIRRASGAHLCLSLFPYARLPSLCSVLRHRQGYSKGHQPTVPLQASPYAFSPFPSATEFAETHHIPAPSKQQHRMAVTCLALARSHAIAAEISTKLASPRVAAILPPPYSNATTAFALRLLEPTPKAIVIGPTFSEHAEEATRVFDEVQKERGVEGGHSFRLPPEVLADGGIEGVAKWVKDQFQSAGIALNEEVSPCTKLLFPPAPRKLTLRARRSGFSFGDNHPPLLARPRQAPRDRTRLRQHHF